MKPNQLHAFAAVAEQLSIRSAARALGVSQPAITKIVRELEREVGAPLVERSVKGVQLTEYGKALAPRVRLLLADMRRAREEIAAIRDGAKGSIVVAVSTSFALTVLPIAFKEFHTRVPAVNVRFQESVLPSMLPGLLDGQLDFAIAHVVPGTLDAEFEVQSLFPVPLAVGLRERHPLRDARSLAELHSAEWALSGSEGEGHEALMSLLTSLFTPLGLPAPARVLQGHSVTVALGLVGCMDLIGLFVEPLVRLAFKRHGIQHLMVQETMPTLDVCVITRRGQRLTPPAQQFVECVQRAAASGETGA